MTLTEFGQSSPVGSGKQLTPNIQAQIAFGRKALGELRTLVMARKNPVKINGKRYLEFCDWQILGSFFGITAYIVDTKEITEERPSKDGKFTFLHVIGFWARAEARQNGGQATSAAEAECMFDEPNWAKKPRFQLRSMAETRACAKVLRQVLQWVVKLPDDGKGAKVQHEEFADEAAEEITQESML